MAVYRPIVSTRVSPILKEIRIGSSISKAEEYWAVMHARVNGRSKSASDLNIRAQHLLDQAERYWNSAQQVHQHYQSSALLYYYSFLNLTKALLVMNIGSSFDDSKKVYHGLTAHTYVPKDLLKQEVNVRDGVFYDYFRLLLRREPPKSIRITHAMSYLMDVGMQYRVCIGLPRAVGFHAKLVEYGGGNKWGYLIRVKRESRFWLQCKRFPNFNSVFERVTTDLPTGVIERAQLDASNIDYSVYHFYQFRDKQLVDIRDVARVLQSVFEDSISWSFYEEEYNGIINVPPRAPESSQWINEELASYVTMFHLSDLVRYRPELMNELLGGEYGQLIRSIVNNCPVRFVQGVASRLMGRVIYVHD